MRRLSSTIVCLTIVFTSSLFFAAITTALDQTIYQCQNSLKEIGYDPGSPDGVWGKKTENAIAEFQRDEGLPITGKLDDETKGKLKLGKLRAHNFSVQEVQELLQRLGCYYTGQPDGTFDPATKEALEAFQRDNALVVNGGMDAETRRTLFSYVVTAHLIGGMSTCNPMIAKVQRRLSELGYYSPPSDKKEVMLARGRLDDRTEKALKSYQEASRIACTGVIDRTTRMKLGMSDVVPIPENKIIPSVFLGTWEENVERKNKSSLIIRSDEIIWERRGRPILIEAEGYSLNNAKSKIVFKSSIPYAKNMFGSEMHGQSEIMVEKKDDNLILTVGGMKIENKGTNTTTTIKIPSSTHSYVKVQE